MPTTDEKMQQSADELKKAAGGLVFKVLESFAFAVLAAFTISLLWGWFAVPLGLPVIGMAHAFGLSMLVRTLAASLTTVGSLIVIKQKLGIPDKPFWERFATFLAVQVLVIFIAWITRLFM